MADTTACNSTHCVSTIESVLKCFTWTIQRFSVRLLKAGDSFRSDVFEAAGYQWRLELRLNGAAQQQHLGVRLLRAGLVPRALGWLLGGGGNDSSSPLKGQLLAATAPLVTYRCTLQSIAVGDGNYWAEKTEHISVDDASSESAGMPCFIDWQAVKSPRRGFLTPQDELTLVCDLTVFGNQSHNVRILPRQPSPVEEQISTTISFGELLHSQKLADVSIQFPDGTVLRAHRSILAARSEVFAAMFQSPGTVETESGVVHIPDIQAAVFSQFLSYIYTGLVPKLAKYVRELLVAANKYGVDRLKDICEATLCADLSAENAYALLELADQCEANRLRKFAAAFINKNWP